jgi:thymidylate kinase
MVSVALIGADGAGKTSLARALERSRELSVKYVYMGINAEASNLVLPTTRALRALKRALGRGGNEGGPPDPARARRPRRGLRGLLSRTKSGVLNLNLVCEEWYRVAVARRYERRGHVVVFDRHFYADYWAHDVAGAERPRSFLRRLHGRLLARLPQPDCTILLDAPAEVLFARKAEGTLELLERRRQEYLDLRPQLANCTLVDASRPPREVEAEVLALLRGLCAGKRGPGELGARVGGRA